MLSLKKRERPKRGGVPEEFLKQSGWIQEQREAEAAKRQRTESDPVDEADTSDLAPAQASSSVQASSSEPAFSPTPASAPEAPSAAPEASSVAREASSAAREASSAAPAPEAPAQPSRSEIDGDMFRLLERQSTHAPINVPRRASSSQQRTASGQASMIPTEPSTVTDGWRDVNVNAEYVPKFGQALRLGLVFEPLPPSDVDCGRIVAVNAGCGRGKSFVFRVYMKKILEENPRARILLMSANILYGTNLAHELKEAGFDVAFYKDKSTNLAAHQVVVCSLESLHHIDGQSFDMLLIDEIRTISTIVGGETMPNFVNLAILRALCHETPRVVVCDADIKFQVHESEPRPIVYDMLGIISSRRVLCMNLTHPGPPHLERSARLFYNHDDATFGKSEFLGEIKLAVDEWKDNNEKRIAICVGSKSQMTEVSKLLEKLKIRWKPYSGVTDDESKARLSDPDEEWMPLGAIVFTTTLSIGVDPKKVQFARVFVWTCRMGCNVLTQAQAAMRFGRSASAPLLDPTISILIDAPPPGVRALEVEEGKKEDLIPPNYEAEVKRLQVKRGSTVRMWSKALDLIGGAITGTKQPSLVSDAIIRLMAHGHLERSYQTKDIHSLVLRVCQHHGWSVESRGVSGETYELTAFKASDDTDDKFAALLSEEEKWDRCLMYIEDHGVDEFFSECYGWADEEHTGPLNALQKKLVQAYWLLYNIQRLPKQGLEESPGKQLKHLDKSGVKKGLELNAIRRCLEPEDQIKRDMRAWYNPDKKKHARDPYLKTDIGMRMMAADECAKLLGISSMMEEVDLPDRIIEIANRAKEKDRPAADARFANELRYIAHQLNLNGDKQFVGTLQDIAKACGMHLNVQRKKDTKNQANGKREWRIESMDLKRVMPDIVDDWLVSSKRLDWKQVRTSDWASAHLGIELETLEGLVDELLTADMCMPLDSTASRDVRFEKLDAAAVRRELARLNDVHDPTDRDARWLAWLQDATKAAVSDKTDPSVLLLTVTYTQLACGRRMASPPSLQDCPSGLRRVVAGRFYHSIDIKSCKPTILLEWAHREQVHGVDTLRECVEHRDDVLQRIGLFYGTEPAKCKFVILRVLSGGDEREWIRDAGCSRNETYTAPELMELKECHRAIRDAMFKRHANRVASLRRQLKITADANVTRTRAEARMEPTSKEKRAAFEKASMKATDPAIDRTIFCTLYFEEEDRILDAMDECFRKNGWNVGSLIYDAALIEHRADASVEGAVKAAEAAVRQNLGYPIQLDEETLFNPNARASEENFWD